MSVRAFCWPNDLLVIECNSKLYSLTHSLHTAAAFMLSSALPPTGDATSTQGGCSLEVNVAGKPKNRDRGFWSKIEENRTRNGNGQTDPTLTNSFSIHSAYSAPSEVNDIDGAQ